MRIYYAVEGGHTAGGQMVNLEHVVALRALGYDARYLVLRAEGLEPRPRFPAGVEVPWETEVGALTAEDVVVVGEMFGLAALRLKDSPVRKVLHNQNPFYTFMAFRHMTAVRDWGCEAIICPSGYTGDQLRKLGWEGPLHVVRPALDPVFFEAPQRRDRLRIAALPRKRKIEFTLIRGAVLSRRPDLNDAIIWVEVDGRPRADVAVAFGGSDIFMSLSLTEGLGLPPLEAMAAGALVVGFHGGGGLEYATPENGDWFDDGHALEIADRLIERVDQLIAGERFEGRREAGRRTAAQFSREAFETALRETWLTLAGPP